MSLLKRIGYYLVGLSIGLVFLSIFFKKKSEQTGVSFCYLPNCRTLKDLRAKPLILSTQTNQSLQEMGADTLDINQILLEGSVNFKLSDTHSVPCKTYLIEGKINEKEVVLKAKNCPEQVEILSIEKSD
ncbi:MAG TPA: hypothetical protein DEQ44_03660 [Flavobacteriaceae bacterium]|jgi:hypothetical protein|nr:hypothetical protein [Flavobacteriaceae bacterium]